MPLFVIRTRNSTYHAQDGGREHDSPEHALTVGVQNAVALAADEIAQGRHSAAVEVIVENEDGTRLLSSVVAISVSPLIVVAKPEVQDAA